MIVGIIGGGQLARMLALAAHPLGVRCIFLDPSPDACARSVGDLLLGHYDDTRLLDLMADQAQVVTCEFESVPAESLQYLSRRAFVYPSAQALEVARDRWYEKQLFASLGIPTPPFMPVDSWQDLESAVTVMGLPAMLKTRTMGYDGKGQWVLRKPRDLAPAFAALGGAPLILEGFVPFDREVSVIAVRGVTGETRFYPLTENVHQNGVLAQSLARPTDPLAEQAYFYAQRLLDHLQYVGVFALELFQRGAELLANEMAPRVHNSGHWTIEGAETSQFENHMRAVLGLPLGGTKSLGYAGMVNFVGTIPEAEHVLAIPGAHFHVYGKTARAGRKLGHATVRAADEAGVCEALSMLRALACS